jgi:hypothetical protein
MYFDSNITDDHKIIGQSSATLRWDWGLTDDSGFTGRMRFILNSNGFIFAYSNSTPSNETWHHVALVRNASLVTFYLNGILDGVANITNSSEFDPVGEFWIGDEATPSAADEGWDGVLDEIAYWNRSFSSADIRSLYLRGATRLNLSVRSCDDAACSGETFTDIPDTSPQNLSVANNTFFQYKFALEGFTINATPTLYNVTPVFLTAQAGGPAAPAAGEGTFLTNATTRTNFSLQNGTFNLTEFNSSAGVVDLNNSPNGTFTSQVLNATQAAVSWRNISWQSNAMGELPNNRANETSFAAGNIDMTDNIFLFHFNNNSAFGENSTVVFDHSGRGLNATCRSDQGPCPVFVSNGFFGGAFNYTFVLPQDNNTHFVINDSPALTLHPNATLAAWVLFSGVILDDYKIIDHSNFSPQQPDWNWGLTDDTGNIGRMRVLFNIAGASVSVYGNTAVQNESWHHVAFTRNADQITFYLDGVADGTFAQVTNDSIDPGYELWIGEENRLGATDEGWDGLIDELSYWNRTFSALEVKALYDRGATRLNLSVRSCDDAACAGETFTDIPDTSPQNLTVANNTFFQYKFALEGFNTTFNTTTTPQLYNATIGYETVAAAVGQNITSCPVTVNASSNVTQPLTSVGSCIVINANNILLECGNNSITGSGAGAGINATGVTGITIRNCNVRNYTAPLWLSGVNGSTIQNVTASGDIGTAVMLSGSSNNSFSNLTMLTNGTWLFSDASSLANNFTNTTFDAQAGRINIPQNVTLPAGSNVSRQRLNISQNRAFLNSTALGFLNTSAIITFSAMGVSSPLIQMDDNDDGIFTNCLSDTCNSLSFAGGMLVFNVSHFTTFFATEGAINLSLTKLDSRDPVPRSTFMNFTIRINVTSGTASNVTLTDIYPNETIFHNAQPLPITGTNNTFIVGNISAGTVFQVNITMLVRNVTQGIIMNNTVNISYQNATSATLTASVRETVKISSPPIVENVTINSTFGTFTADENFTVYFDSYDPDLDAVTANVTDWLVNNQSILLLNMPFEHNESRNETGLIRDYSTPAQNGTLGAGNNTFIPTWNLSGQVGGAYIFDGINDYIQTESTDLQTADNFTITVWIRANTVPLEGASGTFQMILWQGDMAANGYGPNDEMHLSLGRIENLSFFSNDIYFFLGNDTDDEETSGDILNVSAPGNQTLNWTFIAVVVSNMSTAPAVDMYINGVFEASDTGILDRTNRSSWNEELRIGRPGAATRHFNGTLDELLIFNRSLSAAQIRSLYLEGNNSHRHMRVIHSDEIAVGEVWQTCVTPHDTIGDGETVCSTDATSFAPPVFNISNISVIKTDSPDPVTTSSNLSYVLNVTSTGNGIAYNVTVNDTYPAQVIFLTAQPTPVSGTNNTFILGNMTANQSILINITVLVLNISNNTIINNSVNVTFQNETGALLSRTASANTTVIAPVVVFEFIETIEEHFIRVREGVGGQPDLQVNSSSINFNNTHPREFENITINATVCNIGTRIAQNFNVTFVDGLNASTGVRFANLSGFTLTNGECMIVNATYLPPIGNRTINVFADPENFLLESNESNNIGTRTLNVQAYTFYFGNVRGNLTLADMASLNKYTWVHIDAGLIYFFDNDSIFNFSSLQALGRNTTNGTAVNDFGEANENLNMTRFNDSIQFLWATDNSTPRELRNLTVFNRPVLSVPVINSTNSSTFFTGILWDTADDTNGEYNIGDKEDLVFVTNINLSQNGQFKNAIDYEARIPSLLRSYRPSVNQTAFRVELN